MALPATAIGLIGSCPIRWWSSAGMKPLASAPLARPIHEQLGSLVAERSVMKV